MVIRRYWTLVPAALALLAGPAVAEGVYKWVDSQGHTHFGSAPPPGKNAKRLEVRSSTPDPDPDTSAQTSRGWREQLELSNQRRQQAREKEQEAAKQQGESAQRCAWARQTVDSLNRGGARYRLNAQGEREYLDDGQRQAALDSANQRVAQYCRN
ncbi:MAG: DUF4124 domain-containing protein [Gammaproteobacteria bacterium]|nr:DUF4124 domain-containing protein [Gammaproteobacteria bacterium]MBU1414536.1 DUF4124 domain-containing protein [Gammaproteobacteria bacterium]